MSGATSKKLRALEKQNALLVEQLGLYKKKFEQAEKAYQQLLYHFKQLQRDKFGRKSERFVDPDLPIQADLFAEFFTEDTMPTSQDDAEQIEVPAHKRRKKKTNKFPDDLPRREVIIRAIDRICSCGLEKKLIRYEITELLHYIPEVFEVIEQKREVLACSCGESITTAPVPAKILPKVSVTESVIANIIVSKLHDRQPLYHLEKKFSDRFGLDVSRSNLARWFIDSAEALQPLINLMRDEIIDYDVASCDATSIQVLAEPGRAATQKSYLYCMRGGPPDKKVIFYDYNPTEHKPFLVNWFEGFKGYIHVDAQNIFDELGNKEEVNLVYCNAHARRKYEPIAKAAVSDGLAKAAMRIYGKLYKIERAAKDQKMNPTERYDYRLEHAKLLVKEYGTWLEQQYPTVLAEAPLGKAMAYAIRHWPGLVRYLEDGRLEFDNNGTEQQIKPVVIARKNFLFCQSVAGVRAICNHMSLIRSAIQHGFDPYRYYVAILEKTPHCKSVEDYEKLLPWNIEIKKVRAANQDKADC